MLNSVAATKLWRFSNFLSKNGDSYTQLSGLSSPSYKVLLSDIEPGVQSGTVLKTC